MRLGSVRYRYHIGTGNGTTLSEVPKTVRYAKITDVTVQQQKYSEVNTIVYNSILQNVAAVLKKAPTFFSEQKQGPILTVSMD
jgi:hypothetical protein